MTSRLKFTASAAALAIFLVAGASAQQQEQPTDAVPTPTTETAPTNQAPEATSTAPPAEAAQATEAAIDAADESAAMQVPADQLTPAGAEAFIARTEAEALDLFDIAGRAAWVNATYINLDTDALNTYFGTQTTEFSVRSANQAAQYARVEGLSEDAQRKLNLMRSGLVLPAPTTQGAAAELNRISTALSSAYGTGRATMAGETITGNEAEARMGTVRDPAQLQEMWTTWHANGAQMREGYGRLVEIANAGAVELGHADTGALWRSGYDMPPDNFAALTDTLWNEVSPLYNQLHCYVRAELSEQYGEAVQPATGPIRADLLGNMWAQEWGNIYDVVAPETAAGGGTYDLTALLEAQQYTPERIVRTGEAFFSSLGFAPLPATFWERSMITQPEDREVICHASAWNIDNVDDLRIKMCTRVNGDDFVTVHHELGHNYYQRAYNQQPALYRGSANDGFHEAIGDMIALSVTPDYLVEIGLLDQANVPGADQDIQLLLRQAMDKVAFLPFGLLVDRWRWGVFDGSITPANYEASWNDMRGEYQGIVPPVERSEADFSPGAKYHVPASTPYTRYFLARLLQFQFYQAACEQAGWTGPLHRCSFYGNEEVGTRLNAMLAMGLSKPWPDALEAFTGEREMSGEALLAYFAPLQTWLQQQNEGRQCGWE